MSQQRWMRLEGMRPYNSVVINDHEGDQLILMRYYEVKEGVSNMRETKTLSSRWEPVQWNELPAYDSDTGVVK